MIAIRRFVVMGLLLSVLGGLPGQALAVHPDEILSDVALEKRARTLSGGLRCLVCQNQSIDDSDAPLARDLRLLVRERLKAGDSDGAAVDYIVQRYGDFVLLRPPLKLSTVALWAAPLLIFLGGLVLALRAGRPDDAGARIATELTDAEKSKLDDVLRRQG